MDLRIKILFIILFITGLPILATIRYNAQKENFLKEVSGISFEFESYVEDAELLNLQIHGYSDVTLLSIPIKVENKGNRDVYLEKVRFKISMMGNDLGERVIENIVVPVEGKKILMLEEVEITSEKLDEILARSIVEITRAEDATVQVAIEVYLSYPIELSPLWTLHPEIKYSRLEGVIYVRSILGGKTKEEVVAELF
jgi:hypothetical protein